MHYSVLQEAVKIASAIPHGDLISIINKPSTTDRKSDQAWRRLCEKHGIDTAPLGIKTADPLAYARENSTKHRLEETREKLAASKLEISSLKTELARLRIEMNRGVF